MVTYTNYYWFKNCQFFSWDYSYRSTINFSYIWSRYSPHLRNACENLHYVNKGETIYMFNFQIFKFSNFKIKVSEMEFFVTLRLRALIRVIHLLIRHQTEITLQLLYSSRLLHPSADGAAPSFVLPHSLTRQSQLLDAYSRPAYPPQPHHFSLCVLPHASRSFQKCALCVGRPPKLHAAITSFILYETLMKT